MRLVDGSLVFNRALADRLLIEVGAPRCVQLVARPGSAPPADDCFALARALATRDYEAVVDSNNVEMPLASTADLPFGPVVMDCRGRSSVEILSCRDKLVCRSDVVIITSEEVAQLGCRVLLFDDSLATFEAVAGAFKELLRILGVRVQALEMPSRFLRYGLTGVQDAFNIFDRTQRRQSWTAEDLDRYCALICQTWRYGGTAADPRAVRKWIDQFEPFAVTRQAIAVLDYINREGYVPKGEIINLLGDRYAELAHELGASPLPVTIQPEGKSEHMLLYDLRLHDPAPRRLSENVLLLGQPIACFDDVIGSGDTFIEQLYERDGGDSLDVARWLAKPESRIDIIVAVASAEGIKAVETDPRSLGKVRVRAARVLSRDDGIFSSPNVFCNTLEMEQFKRVCMKLGTVLFPIAPLGWGQCEWALLTDYNVPDCSLPVLWADGDREFPWLPLFRRR